MLRRAILILILIGGVTLVVWSGAVNMRRLRRQSAPGEQEKVMLVRAPEADPAASSPLLGKPAPSFTLADLNGKKVSLKDFKGHPLVLNFWGTYCGPCKIEMPWLQELHTKYAGQGFEVVGVTYDAEVGKETIARSTRQLGVTYPILLSDSKAEKDYLSDAPVLPISFYVDRTGTIIEVTAGLGGKDQLEAMVRKTIAANN